MSKRLKIIVGGSLLALTAFFAGLALSVTFGVQAASTTTTAAPVAQVAANDPTDIDTILTTYAPMLNDLQGMVEQYAPGVGALLNQTPLGDGPEVQGIITKVENNGDKLTINNRRVVNVGSSTTIGDANGTVGKDKLTVGTRIQALGAVQSDKSLNARWLLVLPALPRAERGTASAVDATTLKFKTDKGVEWTATLNSDGKVYKDGKEVKLTDLKVNDKVTVVGIADENAKTIKASVISTGQPPKPNRDNVAAGKVKSVDAANNTFTVTEGNGANATDRKVVVDANTKYLGDIKSLSDLKADDNVIAQGEKQADGSLKATTVARGPKPPNRDNFVGGQVASIDAANNKFVVTEKVNGTDTPRTVVVDANTKYGGDLKSLSDLKVGDNVVAQGDKQADGSLKAKSVSRGGKGGPGGRGANMQFGGLDAEAMQQMMEQGRQWFEQNAPNFFPNRGNGGGFPNNGNRQN